MRFHSRLFHLTWCSCDHLNFYTKNIPLARFWSLICIVILISTSITLYFHCLHLFKGRKNQGPKGWDFPHIIFNDIGGVTQQWAELEPWLYIAPGDGREHARCQVMIACYPQGRGDLNFMHPQWSSVGEGKHTCKVQFSLCCSRSGEPQTNIPIPSHSN